MLVDPFFNQRTSERGQTVSFTREQASAFAKEIADDFNPLHDVDAKRFCVPGDLLFALVLAKYGVSKHMRFTFAGMVTDGVDLVLPEVDRQMHINGTNNKHYLSVENSGEHCRDARLVDTLTHNYVTFSGHTFPHVLIPLMHQQQVMINPDRPMVMYESMLIDLDRVDSSDIRLEIDREKTRLDVNGKRGNVCLAFNLMAADGTIGRGEKHMLVSGLRPFEQEAVDRVIADYNACKEQYQSGPPAAHATLFPSPA